MTQSEQREFIFALTIRMTSNNAYIKGFGDKLRVMDHLHNPLVNISKSDMEVLKWNKVVVKEGLIYVLNPDIKPFVAAIDVMLPEKY